MKYNLNFKQYLRQSNLSRQKPKFNYDLPKEKNTIKFNYDNEIKNQKGKETAIYKRRNTEYDIPIPRIQMRDSKSIKHYEENYRSRNYSNEENEGLYPGGKTRLQNEIKQNKYKEKKEIKFENRPKDNKISNYQLINDLKRNKFNEINYYSKSHTNGNSNRSNHSYLETFYSREWKDKDVLDPQLYIIKNEIISSFQNSLEITKNALLSSQEETKNQLLNVLYSISNSMKILIKGQNELINLSKKI